MPAGKDRHRSSAKAPAHCCRVLGISTVTPVPPLKPPRCLCHHFPSFHLYLGMHIHLSCPELPHGPLPRPTSQAELFATFSAISGTFLYGHSTIGECQLGSIHTILVGTLLSLRFTCGLIFNLHIYRILYPPKHTHTVW